MLKTLSVAIYARYSTDRQDARSIDDQLRRCRAYAAERGHPVVAEFKDAAVSGAHLDRADMQRLLLLAQRPGGAPFRAVLVDDLSRLSRDLGNTWRIVFEDLASADVAVVDVSTGLASDSAGARLTFGAMALVNDTFLQLVRTETHRGLQGRALAGFWTGGRVYGYATVEEENPPDPEHRRKRPVIHEQQAEIVRRVFRQFADGVSVRRIAVALNDEGIPAPHDGSKGNKHGNGWPFTTIRAMLGNERYLGRFTWNQSKWVRVPGRKNRRRIARPDGERVVTEVPELAIIEKPLWDAAQARFRSERRIGRRGRPAGTGAPVYLVSGLLRCGVCGGSMSVRAQRMKAGVRYATFGCTTHYQRGASGCPNNLTVSERKASKGIVDAIRGVIDEPRVLQAFIAGFENRIAERNAEQRPDTANLDHQVREAEQRLRNVTEALARVGWSDALAEQLHAEERRLTSLRTERTRAAKSTQVATPDPKNIARYLGRLLRLLEVDRVRGRQALARHLTPIVMTPASEGRDRHYHLSGALNLGLCLADADIDPENDNGAGAGAEVFAKCSSGGALHGLYTAVAEPFEARLAV